MKSTFKFAALALAAMALTVACKNAPAEEPVVADTIDTVAPADTLPAEEPVVDTVVVVKKVVATPKKEEKSKVQQVVEDVNTVKKATLETKKDIQQVAGELKQGEGNTVQNTSMAPTKKNAAEAFKKNK